MKLIAALRVSNVLLVLLAVCSCVSVAQNVGTFAGQPPFFSGPLGLVLDDVSGVLYIADANHAIRSFVLSNGTFDVVAGCNCFFEQFRDGIGTAARMNWPNGVTLDSAARILYVADTYNHAIRSIVLSNRSVTTIAGSNLSYTYSNSVIRYGYVDAVGTTARFNNPTAIAVDAASGVLYVADTGNCAIRKVVISNRNVSTIYSDTSGWSCPNGLALDSAAGILYFTDSAVVKKIFLINMSSPTTFVRVSSLSFDTDMIHGMALDPNTGVLYIAKKNGPVSIVKIVLRTNSVVTVAGNISAAVNAQDGLVDGPAMSATFSRPMGLTLDAAAGILYLAEYDEGSLRTIAVSDGRVTTLARESLASGFVDGVGASALFKGPTELALDPTARLMYVADTDNHAIRTIRVQSGANVSTFAGTNTSGYIDGVCSDARFKNPAGIALDAATGVVYVSDTGNHVIRRIALSTTTVSTIAGTNTSGYLDDMGSAARFTYPRAMALDAAAGVLYVADSGNHAIRRITLSVGNVSTLAGSNTSGYVDGIGSVARFTYPYAIALDVAAGVLYVADTGNYVIRRVYLSNRSVSLVAGSATFYGYQDGVGSLSKFQRSTSLALNAAAGVLYVADADNFVIRSIVLSSRTVSTLAGSDGGSQRDGIGTAAMFSRPTGLTLDLVAAVLYVTDTNDIRNVSIIPCAPGTSLGTTAPPVCKDCAPGSYASLPSQLSCTACATGTYSSDVGRNKSCTACPTGTYNPLTGQTVCVPCPAGTWNGGPGLTSSSSCTSAACSSGSYCPGDGRKVPCDVGLYNPLSGQNTSAACLPCAPGTFASSQGQATCTKCSTGTYSADVGRITSCIKCSSGTFNPSLGQTSVAACIACSPGAWSAPEAATCSTSACTAGYYCPGNITITPCPAGTFSGVTGLSSAEQCTPCAPGTSNPRLGSSLAADCKLCAPGFYGPSAGLAACVSCSVGYFSPGSGSISCQPCTDAYYTNTTGSSACKLCPRGTFGSALVTAQTYCTLCPAGFVSATAGGMQCTPCSVGYSQPLTGQSECTACMPGTYAASTAQIECVPCAPHTASNETALANAAGCPACPSGQFQPSPGQTYCTACDAAMAQFPTLTTEASSIMAPACMPLSKTLVLNWLTFQAAQIGPSVSVVPADGGSMPSWLSIDVVQATYITMTSLEVPVDVADPHAIVTVTGTRWTSTRVFNVTVKHVCRPIPFVAQISLTVTATLPSFANVTASANACPDFLMQLAFSVGSCASHLTATVMQVQLAVNGQTSGLVPAPAFVQMSLSGGTVTVFGTLTTNITTTMKFVVVMNLFSYVAASSPALSITRLSGTGANVPVFAPPDQVIVRACPIVTVTFRAQLAPCGQTVLGIGMLNVSSNSLRPLPSFLNAEQVDARSIQVSGVIPEGTTSFMVVATAAVLGSSSPVTYSSTPVEIVRPATTASVNLSVTLATGAEMWTTDATVRRMSLDASYGAVQQISAKIAFTGGDACTSVSLAVYSQLDGNSSGPVTSSVVGPAALPSWLSLALSASGNSLTISGSLPKEFPVGTQWSFCVRAVDGQRYPTVCFTITATLSLRAAVVTNTTENNNTAQVTIVTPSPLLSISLQLPSQANQETLVCPFGGDAAICSYDAMSRSLGVFGTAAGVNALLSRLRIATTRPNSSLTQLSQFGQATLFASDTVNPATLTLLIPLTAFGVYVGVSQTAPLPVVSALVGIEAELTLTNYFSSGFGSGAMTFSFDGERRFLQLDGSTIRGTALSALGITVVQVLVADRYTSLTANVTLNVTNPLPPLLIPGAPKSWRLAVASGESISYIFPQGVFLEPQGGPLNFDARQQLRGQSVLQPLPPFLQFDPMTLQFSGSPQAADVGTYDVRVIANSQYGPWQGNVSAPLTVVVDLSWRDFFETIYTFIGFALSGLSVLTALLVYRSSLRNLLTSRSWLRDTPPKALSYSGGGRLVCCHPTNDSPIKLSEIGSIRISPLHDNAAEWLPVYVRLQLEKAADSPETKRAGGGISVPWINVQYHRDDTAELLVDGNLVAVLINAGDVVESDRFLVEVAARGWWRDGFLLEAFVFTVRDILSLERSSSSMDVGILSSVVSVGDITTAGPQTDLEHRVQVLARKLDALWRVSMQRSNNECPETALPKQEIDLL